MKLLSIFLVFALTACATHPEITETKSDKRSSNSPVPEKVVSHELENWGGRLTVANKFCANAPTPKNVEQWTSSVYNDIRIAILHELRYADGLMLTVAMGHIKEEYEKEFHEDNLLRLKQWQKEMLRVRPTYRFKIFEREDFKTPTIILNQDNIVAEPEKYGPLPFKKMIDYNEGDPIFSAASNHHFILQHHWVQVITTKQIPPYSLKEVIESTREEVEKIAIDFTQSLQACTEKSSTTKKSTTNSFKNKPISQK